MSSLMTWWKKHNLEKERYLKMQESIKREVRTTVLGNKHKDGSTENCEKELH